MNRYLFLILLFSLNFSFSQEKYTISGVIKDKSSLETVIGANVLITSISKGVVSNEYGYYSLTLPKGNYQLIISFLGYKTINKNIDLNSNQKIDFLLEEDATNLDEVVIKENSSVTNLRSPEIGTYKIPIKIIQEMPVVFGEVDILKSIQMLPGVSNGGEGASGFNVRGGAVDQNLILLDEAIIYNSSHLFGFFSVFNADAVKEIKLYKGGIPARFGGRVSSVLDIRQKDGNKNKFHFNGGIGTISSRLLLEGPLDKNNKSSFLIAGRGSYAHLFLKIANEPNSAYFYDLNTKISYELNEDNSLFLSGYFGRDVFSMADNFNNSYGNTIFNLRWNHLFSDKLFSNLSIIYSDYNYTLNIESVGFDWISHIENYNFKYDMTYYLSERVKIFFGLNELYYTFYPGKIESTEEKIGVNDSELDQKFALESAIYIDVEQEITDRLVLQYGLRFSNFNRMGSQPVQLYENDQPVVFNEEIGIYESAKPISEEVYNKHESIKKFNNLEPRFSFSYLLKNNASIKAGYNRMAQYIHLISNTNSPTPLDVWAPSGKYIDPQILDQFSFGYFKNIKNNKYSFETEVFYKQTENRLDYIDGANLIANNTIETVLLPGSLQSYGFEFLLKKNYGKLTGWVAYTLSKAEQQVKGRTPVETGINNGNWYNASYDKLHDLSIIGQYELNRQFNFGLSFIYQTGRATTYPTGYYVYDDINIPVYSNRNEDNLPAYHHLDISATYIPKKNLNRKWQSSWIFGVYNVYARKNAASISFTQNEETLNNEAVKLSIFGIVPSVTYNFKF